MKSDEHAEGGPDLRNEVEGKFAQEKSPTLRSFPCIPTVSSSLFESRKRSKRYTPCLASFVCPPYFFAQRGAMLCRGDGGRNEAPLSRVYDSCDVAPVERRLQRQTQGQTTRERHFLGLSKIPVGLLATWRILEMLERFN